jgi:ATP-binding cassette subfamily B protein
MKNSNRQTYRIFWDHSRKYPTALFLMLVTLVMTVASDLYGPLIYKKLFNLLTEHSFEVLAALGILWMLLLSRVINWVGWRIGSRVLNFWQPRVMADLVNYSFAYLQEHSYNFFNSKFAGSLVRIVNRFERAFEDITDIFYFEISQTVVRTASVIVILYFQYKVLALIVLIWVGLYYLFVTGFARFKLKHDVVLADMDSKMTGQLSDTISNNINLKLFDGSKKEVASFQNTTEQLFRMRKRVWNLNAYNEAIQGAMYFIIEFAAMYAAIKYLNRGLLTIGDLVLVQGYLTLLFNTLWNLGRNIRRLYERLADAKEMTDILLTPHEVVNLSGAGQLQVGQGAIEFGNVSFGYHARKSILENFNLKIPAGQRVALVGPSGGGKSTIVKLLFRFMDIQAGTISIDGQDISAVTQESLRDNLSLVPQDPILFHRTLFENIAYAKPGATQAEVEAAAKSAHCHEFIMGFPDKYQSFVGERGVKLSGGERQRVAIARAILKNSPILVLDEATSSLDSESESLIQDALKNLMQGKTTIVIAHRLSTIMQMDRIVVLEDGKITEEGKHAELLKAQQGTYQKLWHIQAGGFAPNRS